MYTHTLKLIVLLTDSKQVSILPGTVLQVYASNTGVAWCKTLDTGINLGKLAIGEQIRMPDTGREFIESCTKLHSLPNCEAIQ